MGRFDACGLARVSAVEHPSLSAVIRDLPPPAAATRIVGPLALGAQRGPWDELEPLGRDLLLALLAKPVVVGGVGELAQRAADVADPGGLRLVPLRRQRLEHLAQR